LFSGWDGAAGRLGGGAEGFIPALTTDTFMI